jgi:hypothetical protein
LPPEPAEFEPPYKSSESPMRDWDSFIYAYEQVTISRANASSTPRSIVLNDSH